MAIKILVDSASDISKEEAKAYGIELISMLVTIDNVDYKDGETLLPHEFYEKLIETNALPKTSQVSTYTFETKYEKLVNEGNQVIVITLSSKLSNTYNNALLASKNYKGKVYVIDSLNAAVGERLLCERALYLIKQGKDIKEIVDDLNENKKKINLIAVVDTLKYLRKGGRISKAVAFAGELMNIKPVISIINGEVKLIGKARGSKNANNLLNNLVEKKGGIDFTMPFGTVYSGLDDHVLRKYIKDHAHLWEGSVDKVPSYIVGCTIGTHIGPGAIGLAFFEK